MTFLLLIAAVLIVRLHLLPRHPGFVSGLTTWRQYVDKSESFGTFGRGKLYLIIALPVVLLILIAAFLQTRQWPLLENLFYFVALLMCFDSADLRSGIDNYLDDLKREDIQAAIHDAEDVEAFGDEVTADSWPELHAQTLAATSTRYYECYFPVIFWFGVFGLPGALTYRLVQILSRLPDDQDQERSLRIKYFLDWFPVRLFGIALAVVGNFTPVMIQLRKSFLNTKLATGRLLSSYVIAAIHGNISDAAFDTPTGEILELEELPHLIDRSLVIWIAVCGLVAII